MTRQSPGIAILLERLQHSTISRELGRLGEYTRQSRDLVKNGNFRPLEPQEITALEHQGNFCRDWSKVLVSPDFITDFIHHNQLSGETRLGRFDGSPLKLPQGGSQDCGIYFSSLQDCNIASGSSLDHCTRIQGCMIDSGSIIGSSSITHRGKPGSFGNGRKVRIGIETGGRETRLFLDLSMELAEFLLKNPHRPEIQSAMNTWLAAWLETYTFSFSIVCKDCIIQDSRIEESLIGPASVIQGALIIQDSTLASCADDPCRAGPGCIIRSSVIQEGVSIEDGAIVDSSMLFEHSHVSQHGKVVESILGPNSGVSKGETTSSFLGPFVGFHHQSLLIAAFWPGGRGNIAYGANVGSNHTSRVPDQEFWPGEGMFFGLGCSVKYPSNFSHAPYTIIAAGVTTLPQRMSFPFSLINEPVAYYLEVPPGFNNLIPAWGLSENLYSLYRNEGKYKARNKARRNIFDLDLFRPEIIAYMEAAVRMLKDIKDRKTVYLPGDIDGIGKNMLTDENRLKAIEAYELFLELAGLRSAAQNLAKSPATAISNPGDKKKALHQITRLLEILPALVKKVEGSRTRDYDRGCAIIDDYPHTHQKVEDDPFVKQTRSDIHQEMKNLEALCQKVASVPV